MLMTNPTNPNPGFNHMVQKQYTGHSYSQKACDLKSKLLDARENTHVFNPSAALYK